MIGRITGDDETAYRDSLQYLAVWFQDNNLFLNVSNTKELIEDYSKGGRGENRQGWNGADQEFKMVHTHSQS